MWFLCVGVVCVCVVCVWAWFECGCERGCAAPPHCPPSHPPHPRTLFGWRAQACNVSYPVGSCVSGETYAGLWEVPMLDVQVRACVCGFCAWSGLQEGCAVAAVALELAGCSSSSKGATSARAACSRLRHPPPAPCQDAWHNIAFSMDPTADTAGDLYDLLVKNFQFRWGEKHMRCLEHMGGVADLCVCSLSRTLSVRC